MKFLIVALVLAVLANAEAAPRFKSKMAAQPRVSCDLLSFSFGGAAFGDSACAAHCLILGYGGGYCNGQKVCTCRS
ncbi:PREDICTED: defensin, isoforms B and C-like isoform X3 [Branchiostoma belcheri]|uniref:Defensin, isoforms B and C-like isoform X3 n=1 Tax=Branchiostoma belcheri TaxID=7741 RepID=A0A6P4YV22_BRABE|nr:PREDICTED: defensin, isoforms B and C-like isoform X3 [Branchiostoma belcheri]